MNPNDFIIDIDLKKPNYITEPEVTQVDDATFVINITDDETPYSLANVATVALSSERSDKVVVISKGTVTDDNQVTFKLPKSAVSIVGRANAIVQMYDADNRVSTFSFTFLVKKDFSGQGFVPDDGEKTLIQLVLGDGPVILADAQQATEDARTAIVDVEDALSSIEGERSATEAVRLATEQERIDTEQIRLATETVKDETELERLATEQERQATETERLATESVKDATEIVRTETLTAKGETELATADARMLVDETEYKGPYSAETDYKQNNIVSYNGSSYIAKQDTTGNTPTNNTYWGLLAQRGVDGTGAVSTVNGQSPDAEGNVELVIPDPDLSGLATKQELTAVADDLATESQALATHLAERASLTKEGHVRLSDSVISESNTLAATPSAVKLAYDLAQQAKTDGNSRKSELVDALLLLDPSLPITAQSSWEDIVSSLSFVLTGPVYATGYFPPGAERSLVIGLDFQPQIVIFSASHAWQYSAIYTELPNIAPNGLGLSSNFYLRSNTPQNGGFVMNADGFSTSGFLTGSYQYWIAIGGLTA